MKAMTEAAKVYVIGAYVPNGGTVMAYHLARILHLRFGLPVIVVTVGAETPDLGVFHYEPRFPTLPLDWFEREITADDILICNPSFSDRHFGLKLNCLKIMYVQDFKTFGFLDRFFDHYVTVSDFVHDFLATTYGLQTTVIPPFITIPPDVSPSRWEDRPPYSLLVNAKGDGELLRLLREALRARLRHLAPDIEAAIAWDSIDLPVSRKISHTDFCRKLGSVRYLLNLTPAEGFGLAPLEAMAMGTAVVGFDGCGGRQYMRAGENCLVRPYPDLDGVAADLIALIRDPSLAARLTAAGSRTAAEYGYDRFCAAWERQFDTILGPPQPR